jgi:signal peptidase
VHEILENRNVTNTSEDYKFQPVSKTLLLTKGDNNEVDDLFLYRGERYLESERVMGKVRGYVPYLGIFTIWLTDYPQLKWAMIGSILFFVLVNRE